MPRSSRSPPRSPAWTARYEVTLPRASYEITALPDGSYLPDGLAGCTVVGTTCKLSLARNRTLDFYGTAIVVPVLPPVVAPPVTSVMPADTTGPTVKAASKTTVSASAAGVVSFTLGPFSEPVHGTVSLRSAAKVKASAKARYVSLGKRSFRAPSGKKVTVKVRLTSKARKLLDKSRKLKTKVTITALDALGNTTVKSLTVTVKPAKKKPTKSSANAIATAASAGAQSISCKRLQKQVRRSKGSAKRKAKQALKRCTDQNKANQKAFALVRGTTWTGRRASGSYEEWTFCANGSYTLRSTSGGSTGTSTGTSYKVADARFSGRDFTAQIVDKAEGAFVAVGRTGAQFQVGTARSFGDVENLGPATRSAAAC